MTAVTGAPEFDVVIVGSGFGGSVVALRTASAGARVLVLERGREHPPGSFGRDPRRVDHLLWPSRPGPAEAGLYDLRVLSGLAVVAASGVGGGSLLYAGVQVQPPARVLDTWPAAVRDGLDDCYARVRAVMAPQPLPEAVPTAKRTLFRAAAAASGRASFDAPLAIAWGDADAPGGLGCTLEASCELGCQVGAKRTMESTYLGLARASGAQVQSGAWVSHIAPDDRGGYAVHVRDAGAKGPRVVTGRRVVLSAGVLGSTEILLRSRDVTRTLPNVSARLGHGVSANGDVLATVRDSRSTLRPWQGPDVTTVLVSRPNEPAFSMAAPTSSEPVMRVLAALGEPRVDWLRTPWLRPLAALLWSCSGSLLRAVLRLGLLSRPPLWRRRAADTAERMTFLFGMAQDDAGGRAVLRRGRLDVTWDYAQANGALVEAVHAAMQDVARSYGGTLHPFLTWAAFRRPVTFHPLGGCALSASPASGVVTTEGEVHGHPGLFVADGSVVPTALGFHPAMTIAALAERIADQGVLPSLRTALARGTDSTVGVADGGRHETPTTTSSGSE